MPRSKPAAEALPLGDLEHPVWISEEMGQIEWQLVESRAILPGQFLAGPSHLAAGAGGVGCLYLPESRVDHPSRSIRVEVTRRLGPHVEVDDVILSLVSHDVQHDWSNAVVEFLGAPVERLSVDRKVRLCSLAVHAGARAALCAFDDVTRRHYGRLLRSRYPQCHPDRTAVYDGEHFVEGRALHSLVAALDTSGRIESVRAPDPEPAGVLVGPYALPYEIEHAAATLKGRRLAKGRTLLVCPATPALYRHAQRKGWQDIIVDAGGSILDVGLARRLGIPGLLNLAAGSNRAVYVTGPFRATIPSSSVSVCLGSVRTILEQVELDH